MEINVRHVMGDLREVVIHHESTQIELGIFGTSERKALARTFIAAADELLSGLTDEAKP